MNEARRKSLMVSRAVNTFNVMDPNPRQVMSFIRQYPEATAIPEERSLVFDYQVRCFQMHFRGCSHKVRKHARKWLKKRRRQLCEVLGVDHIKVE